MRSPFWGAALHRPLPIYHYNGWCYSFQGNFKGDRFSRLLIRKPRKQAENYRTQYCKNY
ncbi:hypothetical protein H6G89_32100 [Oscillatoria sp. FACHB-1407]|uniref:hypothetical protein n=1 Tax=Oscillatoria sp. FACHB-1407 TaxID=2692847 RepID=UPI001686C488|nr:hypothetical protein [Oscillatoria sp. FACHB-1407]MBD2465637.1 hypothetical protein [Oscillatoria sp. FACHB-1407]